MRSHELRQLSAETLQARSEELRAEIASLRYGLAHKKEKNVKKLRALRHDLARVLTLQTESVKKAKS